MTYAKIKEIICGWCGGNKFTKFFSKDKNMDLLQCKKCNNMKDAGAMRAEDEKHRIYHETGSPKDCHSALEVK